jgi:hypothetical protein
MQGAIGIGQGAGDEDAAFGGHSLGMKWLTTG